MGLLPQAPSGNENPPCPCLGCGRLPSPKGWHTVRQIYVDAGGLLLEIEGLMRFRVECLNPVCPIGTWTLYEAGGYPHRTYTLSVAISALMELAVDLAATFTSVALRIGCHRKTVVRMVAWVNRVYDPETLARLCARKDPRGLPPPTLPPSLPPVTAPPARPAELSLRLSMAGLVILLLEQLADIQRLWVVPLEDGPGMVVILRHELRVGGITHWLTRGPPRRSASLLFPLGDFMEG